MLNSTKKSDGVSEVKNCKKTSLRGFMEAQAGRLQALGRERCRETTMQALRSFLQFRGGHDISLTQLTSDVVEQYEAWLKAKSLRRNTIGFYMRTLRAAYNRAVGQGLTTDRRPFGKVYTGVDKTIKRALQPQQVRAIVKLNLNNKPHLAFARDMFLFSLFARGMALVDMAFLRKTDLRGSHFTYCRRKTGQMLTVEWIPEMQRILNLYPPNPTQYLLPIITKSGKSDRRQHLTMTENINRALNQIAAMADIDAGLTMYWARHTWGTMARNSNIPLAVISEALGHNNERTTQIYLDSIQSNVVDRANRMVIDELQL